MTIKKSFINPLVTQLVICTQFDIEARHVMRHWRTRMRSHLDTYLCVVLLVLLQQVNAQLCQMDQVLQPLAWRDCRLSAVL